MKKILIKILFRLLESDDSYAGIDDEKGEKWLASQHGSPDFREYFRKRNLQLLKILGTGIEGKNYWILVGQRYELLRQAEQMKKSFEKLERSKKEKKKE